MTVVAMGQTAHKCDPGWEWTYSEGNDGPHPLPPGTYGHQLDLPAKTIWQCECGKQWKAVALRPGDKPGLVMHRIRWKRHRRLSGKK